MSASDSTAFVAGSTTFIVSAESAESAASATTLYVAPPTMAELMKEAFENMPDTLDTKKEIEEYFKNAMKDIVKAKKEAEPKKRKTKKDKEADETDEADEAVEAVKKPKKRKTKKDKDADETDETDAAVKKPKKRKTKKDKDTDTAETDEEEKPKQPKKRKTKKDNDADTDETDEEEKPKQPKQPKRPLTKYQEFFKENYPKIDKAIPNKERCSKVAELWKIHKAELAEKAMDE